MMEPTIAGIVRAIMMGPLIRTRVAMIPLPRIAKNCTAPNGRLKRMVVNESNPNALIIKGPKVVIPPLGMLLLG